MQSDCFSIFRKGVRLSDSMFDQLFFRPDAFFFLPFLSRPNLFNSRTSHIPLGDNRATNGGVRDRRTLVTSAQFSTMIEAHMTGFLLLCGRNRTRPLLHPIARMLLGSLRIRLSGVMATHDFWPHDASHVSSASSGLKCWS